MALSIYNLRKLLFFYIIFAIYDPHCACFVLIFIDFFYLFFKVSKFCNFSKEKKKTMFTFLKMSGLASALKRTLSTFFLLGDFAKQKHKKKLNYNSCYCCCCHYWKLLLMLSLYKFYLIFFFLLHKHRLAHAKLVSKKPSRPQCFIIWQTKKKISYRNVNE